LSIFYLKGLNGLRAIAAIAVIFSHIMQTFGSKGLDLAGFGVTIFIALSGFLITALLLKEKEKTKNISIRKFYTRRILRIWPLYYLYVVIVLLVSWLVYHEQYSVSRILYYCFFMPNIPFVFGGIIGLLAHFWSLGVEEQFYLFWPLVVKKFHSHFVSFGIVFIILFLIAKVFLNRYYGGYSVPYSFLYVTRFDCMAIGGLGAYLFHFKKPRINFLNRLHFQLLAWSVIGFLFFNKFHLLSIFDHEIVAVVTVILIFNQISDSRKMISLENKMLDYLGKISFGLYVYHPLIIALTLYLFAQLGYSTNVGAPAFIFVISVIVLSVLIAHLSYKYFESWFLKQKEKFAVIQSANSTPNVHTKQAMGAKQLIS
jgi:peptidoglycan/LPS O-acetylase OafA/YrhL